VASCLRGSIWLTSCRGRDTVTFGGRLWILGVVAYTLASMRRAIAIFLLLIFGSFLSAPSLAASSDPYGNLPACCRRNGKHHCMMRMMQSDPKAEQVSAPPQKCPFFPHTRLVIQVRSHALTPRPPVACYAALQSHPACHAQSEAQRCIAFDRSCQKRGPPAAVVVG
jgi:hypothetical protein